MNYDFISTSDEETQKLGEEFAQELAPGDVVLLYGELGFGKTTFVKGVARGLGITDRIISPTFTIIRIHSNLHHIDLYRIENQKQIIEVGLKEILQDKTSIKLIEWPKKLEEVPKKRWEIRFTLNKDATRTINIIKYD